MPRDILLINHYAGSPFHGMEYRPYYLAREWVRQGHRVTIAAASDSHVRQHSPAFRGPICEEMLDGIRYVWLRTPHYRGNDVKRAFNILAFVAQLFRFQRQLIRSAKLDAVIASSTYPLDIYPARQIARRHRAKLIFEVHDLWPLTLIELGRMSPRHPFTWLLQRAENYAYRHADRIVSLLPNAKEYMVGHGMDESRFVYLPNGIDVEAWHQSTTPLPVLHRETLNQLRRDGRFLLGYTGSLGLANSLDTALSAADLLRNAPVTFVIVGNGLQQQRLQQQIQSRGLNNVILLPAIPKTSIRSFLTNVDAAFIAWRKSPLYRFGISPNKLVEYMMAGKPVLHAVEAANDPVAEARCGISVAPENPDQFAKAVKTLVALPLEELKQMGNRGKAHVEEHHDYAALGQRFIALFDDDHATVAPCFAPGEMPAAA